MVAVVVAVIIVFGFSQFIVFGFSQFIVFGFSLFIPIAYAGVLAIVANVMPTIDNKAFVEGMRSDSLMLGPLKMAQIVSIMMIRKN